MILAKVNYWTKIFFTALLFVSVLFINNIKAAEKKELQELITKIELINKDLKTLENAFYKSSEIKTSSIS